MVQKLNMALKPKPVTRAYTYSVEFLDLLRNTSQDGSIQIYSDADFEIHKLTASMITDDATPDTVGDVLDGIRYNSVLCQLIENETEQKLSNIPVPVSFMFGTGQEPFILKNPKILAANSTLSIRLINQYSAQDFAVIRLSFIGRKIYRAVV